MTSRDLGLNPLSPRPRLASTAGWQLSPLMKVPVHETSKYLTKSCPTRSKDVWCWKHPRTKTIRALPKSKTESLGFSPRQGGPPRLTGLGRRLRGRSDKVRCSSHLHMLSRSYALQTWVKKAPSKGLSNLKYWLKPVNNRSQLQEQRADTSSPGNAKFHSLVFHSSTNGVTRRGILLKSWNFEIN